MKIQLLMIIAVIVSSLLTISQRANAQEANQFRWLEPSTEQKFNEVVVPDQSNEPDADSFAVIAFTTHASTSMAVIFPHYSLPAISKIIDHTNPRAPPFSLI